MHGPIIDLRSFEPERDGHGYQAFLVFVADLNNDNMVRGFQRHVLGDLSGEVHGMAFGRAQVLELLADTIRPETKPLPDVEKVSRHGCASPADGSHNAQVGVVFAVPNSAAADLDSHVRQLLEVRQPLFVGRRRLGSRRCQRDDRRAGCPGPTCQT